MKNIHFITPFCSLDFIPIIKPSIKHENFEQENVTQENIFEDIEIQQLPVEDFEQDFFDLCNTYNILDLQTKDCTKYMTEDSLHEYDSLQKSYEKKEYENEKKCGNETENLFFEKCKEKNILFIKSTKKQDYYEHFDCILFPNKESYEKKQGICIDIKGKKALRRNGLKQSKYFFVELHKEGWLYNSKSDYIVIEISFKLKNEKLKNSFLFLDKLKLITYVEQNLKKHLPIVTWPEESLLRVYIRKSFLKNSNYATVLTLLPTKETYVHVGKGIIF